MVSGITGNTVRRAVYGITVERATAVLPATGNQTLFTVANGRILLTTCVGEVTTVASATVTNLKLTSVSTAIGGSGTDITANTLVTSLAVGTQWSVSTLGSAAQLGAVVTQTNELIIPPGIIRATTDATNTGAMRWTITYIPLDSGATLVAS